MKSTELRSGNSYGVVASWKYSNRGSRDRLVCKRADVMKAKLTSMDKYVYEVWKTVDENSMSFRKTTATKGFGYKVVSEDGTYWIARPQDIVAPWDELDARWKIQEAREQEAAQKEADRQAALAQKRQECENYAQETKERLTQIIAAVTRKRPVLNVNSGPSNSDGSYYSYVQMDLRVLDALVERLLEYVEV